MSLLCPSYQMLAQRGGPPWGLYVTRRSPERQPRLPNDNTQRKSVSGYLLYVATQGHAARAQGSGMPTVYRIQLSACDTVAALLTCPSAP
ncbi:unnamed protein product [Gadus morhua 'NCC']